jgi:pimeloyl-ACP methyl ester carboxylesterase
MTDHADYARQAAFDLANPDGNRLLLALHGLGGDRQQALGIVDGLARADLAVLAPDLRAHGDTPLVGEAANFTFDALIEDIVALLDQLGQSRKPVYIAGISMGAALALRIAVSGRLDVRGMALVRPAFDGRPMPPNLAVMPVLARLLEGDPAVARQSLLRSPEYREIAGVTASGAASVLDQLTKPLAQERAIRLAEVPKNVAWRDEREIERLEVPALVVGADRDVMHPLALSQKTADMIPAAKLVEIVPRDRDPDGYQRQLRVAVQSHIDNTFGDE